MSTPVRKFFSEKYIKSNPIMADVLTWEPEGWVSAKDLKLITNYSGNIEADAASDPSLEVCEQDGEVFIRRLSNPAEHYRVHKRGSRELLGQSPLVWIDLEMTGLNIEKDKIIEIAVIVSNPELTAFVEGPNLIINCDDATLDSMDEWCTTHHGESGLTQAVKASTISIEQAEQQVLDFLQNTCDIQPRKGVIAGNSIHEDRTFIRFQMPRLYAFLHYRIVDVSSIKMLAVAWYPRNYPIHYKKRETHRALADIRESIGELKHYKRTIFEQAHMK